MYTINYKGISILLSVHCKVNSIQHYVIKFVGYLRQFSLGTSVSSNNKIDRRDNWYIIKCGANHHNSNPKFHFEGNDLSDFDIL